MSSYLERLKKFETPKVGTDKTDKSPDHEFADGFVSRGEGGKFLQGDHPRPQALTPSVSSVSLLPRESEFFSGLSCGSCRHSILPADTCPVSGWRRCGRGLLGGGGFARVPRRCEMWEAAA